MANLLCRGGSAVLMVAMYAMALMPDAPSASSPRSVYRPVLRGTRNMVPAEPKPWGSSNEKAMEKTPGEASRPSR
jgi:hypothetical protein